MCRLSMFLDKCCPFWAIRQVRFALNVLVFSPEEGAKSSVLDTFLDVFAIYMVENDVQKDVCVTMGWLGWAGIILRY